MTAFLLLYLLSLCILCMLYTHIFMNIYIYIYVYVYAYCLRVSALDYYLYRISNYLCVKVNQEKQEV
jgi:hypothetical protein